MKRIFLAPRSNETAYANYISSMQGKSYDEISPFLTENERTQFNPDEQTFVWGCQPGMKARWDSMQIGDYVFFYSKGRFVSVGRLKFKKFSEDLALSLWPKSKDTGKPWSCVFFVEDVHEINLQLSDFNKLTGYNFRAVIGFTPVIKSDVLGRIAERFGSVEAYVRTLIIGMSDLEVDELYELASQQSSNLTKIELAKLDTLTRERTPEENEEILKLYLLRQSSKTPELVTKVSRSFKRNVSMVNVIKAKYLNECQICGFTFKTSKGTYYSEAAHVIPISKALEGIDSPDNIWILCANHHKMLDRGAITARGPHTYEQNGALNELLKY